MVMAADVLAGNDLNCAAWIKEYREPAPEGGAREAREGRRRRRAE
jgi:5-methyltetrahydrofolate--homocysteine methyltransferase